MRILSVILGVALVVLGGWCAASPVTTAVAIGWLFGALLLISGIVMLVSAFQGTKSVWDILLAILAIFAGGSTLCSSFGALIAVDILMTIVAVSFLISGIARIILAFKLRGYISQWWVGLVSGILSVIAALLLITNPFTGLLVADVIFSANLIVEGLSFIAAGIIGHAE